jgi:hypothetical protein
MTAPFRLTHLLGVMLLFFSGAAATPAPPPAAAPPATPAEATDPSPPPEFRLAQMVQGRAILRSNPNALPSLLKKVARTTTLNVGDQPTLIQSFEDDRLFQHPFIFVNFADRADWTFTPTEARNLRTYLEAGGFIHIDAGITAEFLRGSRTFGQHHSFGEWQANPELESAFKAVFPDAEFRPLPRSHDLYRSFYEGLPDPAILPDTVREFVVKEKWPEGTYSAVALQINGRIAVLATPIISMGWGRNVNGGWSNTISFRVREGAPGIETRLANASYGGERFETVREDGLKDVIFCQQPAKPAWVAEPAGAYRVFRYYHSREISDYAHTFFTRLGVNILVYAATH